MHYPTDRIPHILLYQSWSTGWNEVSIWWPITPLIKETVPKGELWLDLDLRYVIRAHLSDLISLDFSPFPLRNPSWQQWFSWLRSVMNWTGAQVWVLTLVTASNLPWPWQKDREREVWVLWLMALPVKTTSPEVKFAGNPRKRVSWNPNNRSHDVCWVVIVYDHRLSPAEGYRCKPHSQLRRVEVIGITVVASVEGMLPDRLGKCKHKLWSIQTGRTLPTARGVKW